MKMESWFVPLPVEMEKKADDVTDNVKTIRSIPLVLHGDNYPDSFEIRGEILMPWEVFEELNREKEST